MKVARVVVRLVVAYFLGGAVTAALFLGTAWASGQLERGIHGDAAAVLFLLPVAGASAYFLLARRGFPPVQEDGESKHVSSR
jgi:hypothetical protein